MKDFEHFKKIIESTAGHTFKYKECISVIDLIEYNTLIFDEYISHQQINIDKKRVIYLYRQILHQINDFFYIKKYLKTHDFKYFYLKFFLYKNTLYVTYNNKLNFYKSDIPVLINELNEVNVDDISLIKSKYINIIKEKKRNSLLSINFIDILRRIEKPFLYKINHSLCEISFIFKIIP